MSSPAGSAPYCGPPLVNFTSLLRTHPEGGVPGLFAGRRAAWSFNTRVAIFAACAHLGLKPGDEILVPAYNCGSEVDPLLKAGLAVRLYPVERDLSVDWEAVAKMVSPATRAVYVIHYFGYLQSGLGALRRFCDAHDLKIIEDCALSLLSGTPPAAGRTGDVSVFCFYKFFPVLGGGAFVDNTGGSQELPAFGRTAPRRYSTRPLLRAAVKSALGVGVVGRLRKPVTQDGAPGPGADSLPDMPGDYYFDPELEGAGMAGVTRRMLGAADPGHAIAARRRNWGHYNDLLQGVPGLKRAVPDLPGDVCPLNFPLLLENRDAVAAALQTQGIEAIPWWGGFHRGLDWSGQDNAIFLKNNMLALPLHPGLERRHIDHISQTLLRIVGKTG